MKPSAHAVTQYHAGTGNLDARIAIHEYGTNPESWWEWLVGRLPRTGKVLEAGAGTGELWRRLPAPGDLTLTDFSPAMCTRLRTSFPTTPVLRADASALPFASGSFDTVVANHMLYHLDDPVVALREFRRVLRPGGSLAIATNGPDHMAELDDLAGLPRWSRLNRFDAETGPGTVASLFADATAERYHGDLDVPSAEPVMAYMDSRGALTPAVAAAIRERVAAEGSYRIRKHTVLITARKPH